LKDAARRLSNSGDERVWAYRRSHYSMASFGNCACANAKAQTEEILSKLDGHLKTAGTDKTRLLSVQIWVADMARDFGPMNAAWEAWVPRDATPARATCEAALASPEIRVEVMVTAAV
jgi:enamine deaminase RidA (YjgF/YER057c/UK114 family)